MDTSVPDWTEAARCKGLDLTAFFQRNQHAARGALQICRTCSVRDDCLTYAIDNDMHYGVWGGLTERQRRAHARRRSTIAAAT